MLPDYKDKFLTTQLISYLGNKRRLLGFLDSGVQPIKTALGKSRLTVFDGFAGAGSVSRLLKTHASQLYVNDMEPYACTVNRCFLANPSDIDEVEMHAAIDYLNAHKLDLDAKGFIASNYAPVDDQHIVAGERAFYTTRNARIIDNMRIMIRELYETATPWLRPFLIAPLLTAASIHTNTSGIFRGFHKNKKGIGHYGGEKEVSVERILRDITLQYPILQEHPCHVEVTCGDTNKIVTDYTDLDLVYYDPPYNQHAYGANYFMLNVIDQYDAPALLEESVTGIVKDWQRSAYNKRHEAEGAMEDLISKTDAKYTLISYNNEGIIPSDTFRKLLTKYGKVTVQSKEYATFGGCRNMGADKTLKSGEKKNRTVDELLWTLKK